MMLPASVICFLAKTKCSKLSRLIIMMIFLSNVLHGDLSRFFNETDELMRTISFRSFQYHKILLNSMYSTSDANLPFDADSFPIISDLGYFSTSTPYKGDFIQVSYEPFKRCDYLWHGIQALGLWSKIGYLQNKE